MAGFVSPALRVEPPGEADRAGTKVKTPPVFKTKTEGLAQVSNSDEPVLN